MAARRGAAAACAVVFALAFIVSASHAQSADADVAAAQDTGAARDALHQAEERLKGLQAAYEQEKGRAEASGSELAALKQRALAAEQEAAALQQGKLEAEAASAAARKAQKAAEAEREALVQQVAAAKDLAPRLSTAEAQLATAEASLAKAEADLKAAEARADESQRLADSLLAQHYEEWVPHWVADGYERKVRPAVTAAWETTSETGRQLYRSSSVGAERLWAAAGPTVQTYTDAGKQYAYDAHQKVVKHPHMAALKRKWDEAWQKVLSLPLVRTVLAQAARTQAELEALFGKFLRAYPLLAPLGDKGAIKYVVWGVLAAPLLALLIPALLLPKKKQRALPAGSSSGGRGSASKAKKGRRITMGGESVSFA